VFSFALREKNHQHRHFKEVSAALSGAVYRPDNYRDMAMGQCNFPHPLKQKNFTDPNNNSKYPALKKCGRANDNPRVWQTDRATRTIHRVMNDRQESKYNMYLAVEKVIDKYQAVWSGNQGFSDAVTSYKGKLKDIKLLTEVQEKKNTGIRKDKVIAWDTMRDEALVIGGAVYAYATSINNQTLKDAVNYTATDLSKVRDTLAAERCRVILDEANDVAANLINFGISAQQLLDYEQLIIAFETLLVAPRMAIVTKKGATKALKTVMSDTDGILKDQMDRIMPQFKLSAPDFYVDYFNARIIIETGSSKPSVTIAGTCKESVGKLALEGVFVKATVVGDTKNYTYTTGPDGLFKVGLSSKSVGTGATVNLVASITGFEDALATIVVQPNKSYVVDFLLTPLAP